MRGLHEGSRALRTARTGAGRLTHLAESALAAEAPGINIDDRRINDLFVDLRREFDRRFELLEAAMKEWRRGQPGSSPSLPPKSAEQRAAKMRVILRLRGQRQCAILTQLVDNPDNIHEFQSFFRADEMDDGEDKALRKLRVYVSDIRAALAEHGLANVIHNEKGKGYFILADDAARIRKLWGE